MTALELRHPVRVQLALLGVLGVVYLLLAAAWVPPHNRLLLPMGVIAFAGAAWLGRSSQSTRDPGQTPLVVWFALLFLLVLIPVAGPPAPRERGFLTGFLGVFCALGLWAIYRYPSSPADSEATQRSIINDVLWGVVCGVGIALLFSLFAVGIAVISLFGEQSLFTNFAIGYIIAAYFVGGLVGGAWVGLLRPFSRWPLGTMLIGIPVAAAAYGAIGGAIMLIENTGVQLTNAGTQDFTLQDHFWTLFSIAVVAGPVGALYFRGIPEPEVSPRLTKA